MIGYLFAIGGLLLVAVGAVLLYQYVITELAQALR